MRKKAEEIFLAGVESVLPEKLIQTRIKRRMMVLQLPVNHTRYPDSGIFTFWQPEKQPL